MNILIELLSNEIKFKNKEDLCNNFKLPIEYTDKIELNNNVKNDLELLSLKNDNHNDNSDNVPTITDMTSTNKKPESSYSTNLYYCLLNPENNYEKKLADKWGHYYTNNREYLLDTQQLIKKFKQTQTQTQTQTQNADFSNNPQCIDDRINDECEQIFYNNSFVDTYEYINLPFLNKYNNNEIVMQILSSYNLASPIFSLLIPIISLLIPFFIIKLQGHKISFALYFEHLKSMFSNHVVGKLFTNFQDSSFSTKIYLIASVGVYIFQIYSNFISCIKYYKNIKSIHNTLFDLKDYLSNSIANFQNLLTYTDKLPTYNDFNVTLKYNLNILSDYRKQIEKISPYNLVNKGVTHFVKKVTELGYIMKTFYRLHDDENLIRTLYYTIDCNGYISNINSIQKHMLAGNMNYCKFIDKETKETKETIKTTFKNAYYGFLLDSASSENVVKNSYTLDNNLILTGPNAAGKTTILKTTLFNIILSQQIGGGFYDDANIDVYDFIHCYINIPDTSNRDSLFQAEARQCRDILEIIDSNKSKKHFCVFDELYSGTNPDEAVKSAYSYLKYLETNENVNFILTTHYYKLCKKIDTSYKKNDAVSKIKNYHMQIKYNKCENGVNGVNGKKEKGEKETKDEVADYIYSYKLKPGISKIKGGLKVLKDLNYPEVITNHI